MGSTREELRARAWRLPRGRPRRAARKPRHRRGPTRVVRGRSAAAEERSSPKTTSGSAACGGETSALEEDASTPARVSFLPSRWRASRSRRARAPRESPRCMRAERASSASRRHRSVDTNAPSTGVDAALSTLSRLREEGEASPSEPSPGRPRTAPRVNRRARGHRVVRPQRGVVRVIRLFGRPFGACRHGFPQRHDRRTVHADRCPEPPRASARMSRGPRLHVRERARAARPRRIRARSTWRELELSCGRARCFVCEARRPDATSRRRPTRSLRVARVGARAIVFRREGGARLVSMSSRASRQV